MNRAAEMRRAGRLPRASGIRPAGTEKRQNPAIKDAVMMDFEVDERVPLDDELEDKACTKLGISKMPENKARCKPEISPPRFAVTHIWTSRRSEAVGNGDADVGVVSDDCMFADRREVRRDRCELSPVGIFSLS